MGAWAAAVESGLYKFASVNLGKIRNPSQYILSGDVNHGVFNREDADPDNYTWETLFSTNSPAHSRKVNVMFADSHVATAARFQPNEMTYSALAPGVFWTNSPVKVTE